MEPVRVKAYGLVPITRPTYLALQSVGAVVLLVLYLTADRLPIPPHLQDPWRWFIVAVAVLEVVETSVMLWRFNRAEQAARAWRGAQIPPPPRAR